MATQQLPPDVADRLSRLLELLDEAKPEVVKGLHVIGSMALGDYQPGHSDLDIVVVTREPLGAADVDAIDEVHQRDRRERNDASMQASYLTTSSLATKATAVKTKAAPTVWHSEGETRYDVDFEINPITWRTLVRHSIPVRGTPAGKWMRDPEDKVITEFCRTNLATYWAPRIRAAAAEPDDPDATIPAIELEWLALGPPRLVETINTGRIISKSAAGETMIQGATDAEERAAFSAALETHRSPDAPSEVPISHRTTVARALERLLYNT